MEFMETNILDLFIVVVEISQRTDLIILLSAAYVPNW